MKNTSKIHNNTGDEQVVESGGVITVKSGGGIVVENGGMIGGEGGNYTVTVPDDETLEVANDELQIKDGGVTLAKLATEVTALTDLVAAIPTEDEEDGETIWNDNGVLKVSSAGE